MGTIILPATLDYRIRHPWIRVHADRPQAIDMQATPLFTTCNPQPADDAVVYDVLQLLDSGRRAGAYSFLTCECGVPDDVGILGKTCVTHDDTRILWTMAIVDFKPIIAAAWHGQAETLQLVFDKEPYRRTVHNILAALQRRLRDGVRLDDLCEEDFTRSYHGASELRHVRSLFPDCKTLPVDTVNPYDADGETRILALDLSRLWD